MKNRNLDHKDDWKTPPEFYKELNDEFNFVFDPCPWQHDISEWDGLKVDWGIRNFINPPYTQKLKEAFVKKAIEEMNKGKLCVMLLPVSTSTKLFHDHILPNKSGIRFVKRRISFIGYNSKGQLVNFHLLRNVDYSSKIVVPNPKWSEDSDLPERITIQKHVKNSGQHDSMIVVFDGIGTYS